MRRAVIIARETVSLEDGPERPPAPGDVRVRVVACGICGSDLHVYHNGTRQPVGHEVAGVIDALGEGVGGLDVGQPVAVEPWRVCRRCATCRAGRYHLCPERRFLFGGLADSYTAPAYSIHPLPDGIDPETGALAEPVAVAVHGLRAVRFAPGERVLVLGGGAIGLLTALVARAWGAADVLLSARYPHQAAMAERFGARAFMADEAGMAMLNELVARRPVPVVVETVGGTATTLDDAIRLVASGGRISVLGLFQQRPSIDALALVRREIQLCGAITYGMAGERPDFALALDLLRVHGETARQMVTHRIPLASVATALATAADKRTQAIKVSVLPSA